MSAPAFSAIHAATQQWSTMKLLGGGEAVVGERCTTFSLFQLIYLLPVFHPLKISYTLDVFASSHGKLAEILSALISCERKSLWFFTGYYFILSVFIACLRSISLSMDIVPRCCVLTPGKKIAIA